MLIFLKSRISLRSDIAGEAHPVLPRELIRKIRRLSASLTARLIVLVGIFIALPIVLYGQFESVDHQTRELVVRSIQDRSWLIAQALKPILDGPQRPLRESLGADLMKYSADGTILRLMLQPSDARGAQGFYFVASAPPVGSAQLNVELNNLAKHGIVDRLAHTCTWDKTVEIRYDEPDGREQIMTSVIPIRSQWGCWVLVSSHATSEFLDTSIGRPYWQTHEVRFAASIYLVVALLAGLIAWSVWRNVRNFRSAAREIREGRGSDISFTARNSIPELSSVAGDIDRLVSDLRKIAHDLRQTAEDNAHSFKAPVATIQSALEPVRRLVAAEDERATRSIALIDSSLRRLKSLISAAQRLDNNAADLIDAPRLRVDLTRVVADVLLRYRDLLAERGLRLTRQLSEHVFVRAGGGVLEVVIENILDNAISFSPNGGNITVSLARIGGNVDLQIEDEGPGIDAGKIGQIFERYFSLRPADQCGGAEDDAKSPPKHAGLGLWIVRHNVEALGGHVSAANRVGGGLRVRISLPTDAAWP